MSQFTEAWEFAKSRQEKSWWGRNGSKIFLIIFLTIPIITFLLGHFIKF